MARVRKQAGAKELLYSHAPVVVLDNYEHKGKWQEVFPSVQPLEIEIGMGRGNFILEKARQNPDKNFLGIEVIEEIINEAIERMEQKGGVPDNLRFIWMNAQNVADIFAPNEVSKIYLNFSDPWPKNRHRKRRLTHSNFLKQYREILTPDGFLEQKTDSRGLFEFSLNELAAEDWRFQKIALDLYENLPEDNIATEYEEKFVKRGLPIYYLKTQNRK